VLKLCKPGSHKNVVEVFRVGDIVAQSRYYYLDMKVFDLSLDQYLRRDWTNELSEKAPYLAGVDKSPESLKTAQTQMIMQDIVNGVAFIHSQKEIHRDLKPSKSTFPKLLLT
jgi:serine/threonine protein kinase